MGEICKAFIASLSDKIPSEEPNYNIKCTKCLIVK